MGSRQRDVDTVRVHVLGKYRFFYGLLRSRWSDMEFLLHVDSEFLHFFGKYGDRGIHQRWSGVFDHQFLLHHAVHGNLLHFEFSFWDIH